ncbi:glycoside hydrolase family 2 protein [Aureibaculum algae]|uniref:Glycoside hydrolase family 2 protein n=1 Tax=Aureibaculum algae TaxID=2584122 RepID=A0A5B7TZW9_9FLAO|nr:glycoside hydrolase family 2 TIM barrel-domain containing protein [Aureibaculum algae]QCX40327.1 glycoside hydrolase family 2 protein [Aureibaculum algae]
MKKTVKISFALAFFLVQVSFSYEQNKQDFGTINFNKNWLFHKDSLPDAEMLDYNDTQWRKLNLPHDWAIEGPFDKKYNARTGGLPVHGVAWYRKHFTVAKNEENKQISIEFDGAMSNAKVWLNGIYIGERPYGYVGFSFDLTEHIQFGKDNIIAVQLAPEDLASRWYSGAGIYRNVRLKIKSAVHIPQWGTKITTPKVVNGVADVAIATKIKNTSAKEVKATLETVIIDANGKLVTNQETPVILKSNSQKEVTQNLVIKNAQLWQMGNSYMYKAISSIKIRNKKIDAFQSDFGVRTIEFDANNGFSLNGKQVELNGVCMHHDQGPLGAAINYRAKERQMQIMQSMGVNALRTSHNPPSPEMLKVCNALGIVVIVEAFDEWKIGKVENGYHKFWEEWHEIDLRDMINRDRNHPSVIMWSIGNEILEQSRPDGWKITKELNDICHEEDPTRPTTIGFNYYPAPFKNKLADYVDVIGMNYWPKRYGEILTQNPNRIVYGSETSSMTSSRGVYHLPIEFNERHETNQVSSYDAIIGPPWAYAPDVEFDAQEAEPKSLGEFIWTGFDYLGEPTPYGGRDNSTNGHWNDDWPSRSSYFAPVDLAGFPKDRYYLYQSQWTTEPMVHVLPHWNWEGKEGQEIPVYSYTNCEEVELFVNGKSFGKKIKGKDFTEIPSEFHDFEKGMYKTKYRLSWAVPYQPGTIKVVGYVNGEIATTKQINTAGVPAKIKLEADRSVINADDEDLSFITVRIEDKEGNLCPNADNLVTFSIAGLGKLAAVGNGDANSLASFQIPERKAFQGLCLLVVKSTEKSGEIHITASSNNLEATKLTVKTTN